MNTVVQLANSLEEHWMPFTANRHFKANPRIISGAKGMYYTTDRGDQILDGSSGLFCVAAGHGRREIAEAVNKALLEIDYVPPFQFGHPASFSLARRLSAITPGDVKHVFFVNSGSESVDSALKIALAYHRARGEGQRMRLVGREKAYHGVNFGGISVAGMVNNKKAFGLGLPGVCHLRHTMLPEHKFVEGQPETGAELAEDLQRLVDLQRLREICDQNHILLIFDEVICAFGRTGKAFGSDSFGVVPDMITMAKALTNGVVPMGAVACSEKIYETITQAAPESAVELFHGYTYSGCPVASAASHAALTIYEEEGLFDRAATMSPRFLEAVFSLKDLPVVTDIRGYGMLAGIDLAPKGGPGERGLAVMQELYAAGLMVKVTGDCALVAPPLVCEDQHIAEMAEKLRSVLKAQ
jgi:beta-alanine--pyruvate transaminase